MMERSQNILKLAIIVMLRVSFLIQHHITEWHTQSSSKVWWCHFCCVISKPQSICKVFRGPAVVRFCCNEIDSSLTRRARREGCILVSSSSETKFLERFLLDQVVFLRFQIPSFLLLFRLKQILFHPMSNGTKQDCDLHLCEKGSESVISFAPCYNA